MMGWRWTAPLAALGLAIVGAIAAIAVCASAQTPPCAPAQPASAGWSKSFIAGCVDRNGAYAGGSQIIHLVAHKGRLYAADGYWMDSRNIVYGGHDPRTGWGQILSLAGPDQPWTVDLDMGPRHLRPELLKEVVFTRDGHGAALPEPASLLIAAAYQGDGRGGVDVFTRDDDTGGWVRSSLIAGSTGRTGEDNSVRAASVHTDRVTGQQRVYVSVGVIGLFSGAYDAAAPGKIAWAKQPEASVNGTRILGVVEANGSLFYSDGDHVYRRIDGETPRYEVVADMSAQMDPATSRTQFSAIGGIRGLTAIDGPIPGAQSLIFMWDPGKNSRGCIIRLDPQPDGAFTQTTEACLADLTGEYLGLRVPFVLGAYSTFMRFQDPATGEARWIVGVESFLPGARNMDLIARNERGPNGGFYAGAMYAVRDPQGHWRAGEVNGRFQPGKPELVSDYTYALSPFGGADRGRIYLGGLDANGFASTNTSWVYRTDVANLLGERPQPDGASTR